MPDTATEEPPASAVTPEPKAGETPPPAPPKPAAETQSKTEQARAALKGEPPKGGERDTSQEASIDALFDPETGQLLELEPETGETPSEEVVEETPEAKGEREDAEAAAKEAEEAKKGDTKRFRIQRDRINDRDFAIIRLMDDKGISYQEAEKALFGDTQPKPKEAPAPENKGPSVADLKAEIAKAEAALDKASDAMDTKEATRLVREIARLERAVERTEDAIASSEKAQFESRKQQYLTTETDALTKITKRYPEAGIAGSDLLNAVDAKAAEYRQSDPAFFHRPTWPITLVTEVATELGISPTLEGAAKTPEKPVIAPKKPTRPAINPAPGSATSAASIQNTEATLRAELKAAKTPEETKIVMRKIDAMGRK